MRSAGIAGATEEQVRIVHLLVMLLLVTALILLDGYETGQVIIKIVGYLRACQESNDLREPRIRPARKTNRNCTH